MISLQKETASEITLLLWLKRSLKPFCKPEGRSKPTPPFACEPEGRSKPLLGRHGELLPCVCKEGKAGGGAGHPG
jgi:hypothetical protein